MSGAGKWWNGITIGEGSIMTNGYAFHYKGDASNGATVIRRDGTLLLGLNSTGLGNPGDVILKNNRYVQGLDSGGTVVKAIVGLTSADRVSIDQSGGGVQFGLAVIAMGGGAAPTVGTIGGSGPATAGQNAWKKEFDSTGTAYYIPIWR